MSKEQPYRRYIFNIVSDNSCYRSYTDFNTGIQELQELNNAKYSITIKQNEFLQLIAVLDCGEPYKFSLTYLDKRSL